MTKASDPDTGDHRRGRGLLAIGRPFGVFSAWEL